MQDKLVDRYGSYLGCIDNCAIGMDLDVAPLCIELHYRIPVNMLLVHIVGLIVSMSRQQRPLEVLIPNCLSACCGYALSRAGSQYHMARPLASSWTGGACFLAR